MASLGNETPAESVCVIVILKGLTRHLGDDIGKCLERILIEAM